MAHAQKPNFVFRRNGRVYLNRQGCQFSRLPAVEVCALAVVMVDTPFSEVVRRVLATHCIRQFPLHFPSRASPCAIRFQLDSTSDVLPCNLVEICGISGFYRLHTGSIGCPETSEASYQSTSRNNPEERSPRRLFY